MMKDGSVKQADLIVLATGYEGQAASARRIFGDEVGDRMGPVWGFDEEGELQGMWRPTGQQGLWFLAGGTGAVPHLLEGACVADQGAGARDHCMIAAGAFDGKVALITGAGGGIGLATAEAFAKAGASVVLADRDKETVAKATGDCGPRAITLRVSPAT